jgi:vancomycin resistance protein YoaR
MLIPSLVAIEEDDIMLQIATQRPLLFWIMIILAVLLFISSAAGTVWALTYTGDERIAEGIWAGQWELGGLTREQAAELIDKNFSVLQNEPILLEYSGREWSIIPGEAGIALDTESVVEAAYAVGHSGNIWRKINERRQAAKENIHLQLPLKINNDQLLAYLTVLKSEIDRPAKDAWLTWNQENGVKITSHQTGQELELDELAAQIRTVTLWSSNRRISLPVQSLKPDITYDELAGFRYGNIIAQYSTIFDPTDVERTYNVALAAKSVDKILLRPGDIFSFNNTVGSRTEARGYRVAPVLVNGELVPGIGGGICQVSSTLFNAALLADLRIVKRTNHSRPVTYVPLGRDATVVDNAIDFQFMNDTNQPLYILSEIGDNSYTVRLLGYGQPASDQNKKIVKITSKMVEELPFGELVEIDPTMPPGERQVEKNGAPGYRMELWRQVTVNNVIVKNELLGRFQYRPVARRIKVGPEIEQPENDQWEYERSEYEQAAIEQTENE